MKNWILILLIFFICSCASRSVQLKYYLSILENIKELPLTENEDKQVDSLSQNSKELSEKCKRENLNCLECPISNKAEFKGGTTKFRMFLFNNFKLPKNAQIGENRVRITIGKANNLEKIEILKFTDANSKKAVEEVFKMKELGNWSSAKIYNIPTKTQFEISIFIVKK